MSVIEFPKQQRAFQPVGHYIRLGDSSYKKVADLVAAGVITSKRFVVNGSKIKFLKSTIQMLQGLGAEVVLDPRTIELSSLNKCGGHAASAPWAAKHHGAALQPDVFRPGHPSDIYGAIARTAVEYGVDAVLAPTHFLADPDFSDWYILDMEGCSLLRNALDREGGNDIALDYLLAARLQDLSDQTLRAKLMTDLPNLPIEVLWVRGSMTSPDKSPANAVQLIRALAALHNLGMPIVMDHVGGLAGEALLAMNVVSAISHGYGEHTSFVTSNWNRPPKKRDPGSEKPMGRAKRVGLSNLGQSFTTKETRVLLSAHRAKTFLLPNDRNVLPNGIDGLLEDPRRFNAADGRQRIEKIDSIPTANRPTYFCEERMSEIVATAKAAQKLKPKPAVAEECRVDLAKLQARIIQHRLKSEQLKDTFEEIALDHSERVAPVRAIGAPRVSQAHPKSGSA